METQKVLLVNDFWEVWLLKKIKEKEEFSISKGSDIWPNFEKENAPTCLWDLSQ